MADHDKFEILDKIGHGSFGVIRKVRRRADNKIQCRKEINYLKMSVKEREQLQAEFSILSSLDHPNIVQYYHREHIKSSQDLYIYMEYCGGGDLGMIIRELSSKKQLAKEDFVWRIFAQLITALYRCHNGEDAPEPGSNPFAQKVRHTGPNPKNNVVILHRDLKPENVFLGEDQAVKLGDFGLSKLLLSHDFASTYVGTPYYMSPEICNAEHYTSASDIWALGCIIHELCTTETPFNAKSHFHLMQKIRKCDLQSEVPDSYSPELRGAITSCLNLNPKRRPDTGTLLSIPYVWIARKGIEMVNLGKEMKRKENLASQRLQSLEADQASFKQDLDNQLRREWELKAQLEITYQADIEREKLRSEFDRAVEEKVQAVVSKLNRKALNAEGRPLKQHFDSLAPSRRSSTEDKENLGVHGSSTSTADTAAGTEEDDSALSTTDATDLTGLSGLSIESPRSSCAANATTKASAAKKASKAPFTRSRTTFDSPIDVDMAEPSPITLSSLALSPRRNPAAQVAASNHISRNIFAEDAQQRAETAQGGSKGKKMPFYRRPYHEYSLEHSDGDDSGDDLPDLPSPTRPKVPVHLNSKDPFKVPMRPGLGARQKTTATMQKLTTQPTLFPTSNKNQANTSPVPSQRATNIPTAPSAPNLAIPGPTPSTTPVIEGCTLQRTKSDASTKSSTSPIRAAQRFSKIPAAAGTAEPSTSPTRGVPAANMLKSKAGPNVGRTLMDLAQARAGGRPVSRVGLAGGGVPGGDAEERAKFAARLTEAVAEERLREREGKAIGDGEERAKFAAKLTEAIAENKARGRGDARGDGEREREEAPAAVWDPERDVEMPSPFITRNRVILMR